MIRVGKVAYTNTIPLFYSLRGFEVVEGHPTELVKLLREGGIDAGIVSSVEYFFNPEDYLVLPDVSISSVRKVCSVLLLSKVPIEEVRRVKITPLSLTSRYLLLYILRKGYSVNPEEVTHGEDAFLCIGDEALDLRKKTPYVYDLGEEWNRLTGLPFVFALFLVRREVPGSYIAELLEGIRRSLKDFFSDLKAGRFKAPGGVPDNYFSECIDYNLGEEHLTSLRLFFEFMTEETGRPVPRTISLFRP